MGTVNAGEFAYKAHALRPYCLRAFLDTKAAIGCSRSIPPWCPKFAWAALRPHGLGEKTARGPFTAHRVDADVARLARRTLDRPTEFGMLASEADQTATLEAPGNLTTSRASRAILPPDPP